MIKKFKSYRIKVILNIILLNYSTRILNKESETAGAAILTTSLTFKIRNTFLIFLFSAVGTRILLNLYYF